MVGGDERAGGAIASAGRVERHESFSSCLFLCGVSFVGIILHQKSQK